MKLLLDTHIFLWFICGDKQLPISMRDAICNMNNDVYLSVVSLWETIIKIKYKLGKIPLPQSPEIYLPEKRLCHQISSLPLDEKSISQLSGLPPIHRDPFDRMLICQAIAHDLTLVTVDNVIRAYPVSIFTDVLK